VRLLWLLFSACTEDAEPSGLVKNGQKFGHPEESSGDNHG
jgi:hypothetical protein